MVVYGALGLAVLAISGALRYVTKKPLSEKTIERIEAAVFLTFLALIAALVLVKG
jgi:hypothetical protein